MFDTKTMKVIKTIDVAEAARPDGIYFDPFNERVYIFSHPTKDATVIDAKDGAVLGTIDLGDVPEQGVGDGKGMLYVVMQDAEGSVTAVDARTMKAGPTIPSGTRAGATDWPWTRRTKCSSQHAQTREIRPPSQHSP